MMRAANAGWMGIVGLSLVALGGCTSPLPGPAGERGGQTAPCFRGGELPENFASALGPRINELKERCVRGDQCFSSIAEALRSIHVRPTPENVVQTYQILSIEK